MMKTDTSSVSLNNLDQILKHKLLYHFSMTKTDTCPISLNKLDQIVKQSQSLIENVMHQPCAPILSPEKISKLAIF